jgi:putative glutamine amidotransferase
VTPVVLVTADRRPGRERPPGRRVRPPRDETWVLMAYVDAVARAGGLPLLVPPGTWDADALLDAADGLLLTGGDHDIDPRHYGEEPTGPLGRIEPLRTGIELDLARAALRRGTPMLGICGGAQAMAVAAGGRLVQDLPTEMPHTGAAHVQDTDPATPCHRVRVEAPATAWLPRELFVNSTHHQAVRDPGSLVACGWADDGVIEVIAAPGAHFTVGVQWHPELLGQDALYEALCRASAALSARRPVRRHRRVGAGSPRPPAA